MVNEINSYVEILTLILDTIILERHVHVTKIKPYEEMQSEFEKLSAIIPNITLTPISDIFNIASWHITTSTSGKVRIEIKIRL